MTWSSSQLMQPLQVSTTTNTSTATSILTEPLAVQPAATAVVATKPPIGTGTTATTPTAPRNRSTSSLRTIPATPQSCASYQAKLQLPTVLNGPSCSKAICTRREQENIPFRLAQVSIMLFSGGQAKRRTRAMRTTMSMPAVRTRSQLACRTLLPIQWWRESFCLLRSFMLMVMDRRRTMLLSQAQTGWSTRLI